MTLPSDTSSNEVLRLVALLRQIDQLLYKVSQSPDWETMRPYVRELCEGMYDRMRDESDRIRMVMIPQIREAYLNAAPPNNPATAASPAMGMESDDCIVPEEDIVRLIKDHFSASQQKHFLVSVGLNEEKPKASVRNFAEAVLALYVAPEAATTPTEGLKE